MRKQQAVTVSTKKKSMPHAVPRRQYWQIEQVGCQAYVNQNDTEAHRPLPVSQALNFIVPDAPSLSYSSHKARPTFTSEIFIASQDTSVLEHNLQAFARRIP